MGLASFSKYDVAAQIGKIFYLLIFLETLLCVRKWLKKLMVLLEKKKLLESQYFFDGRFEKELSFSSSK